MTKKPSVFREFYRKRLVTLKRKPQLIAMLVLVAAYVGVTSLGNLANLFA